MTMAETLSSIIDTLMEGLSFWPRWQLT